MQVDIIIYQGNGTETLIEAEVDDIYFSRGTDIDFFDSVHYVKLKPLQQELEFKGRVHKITQTLKGAVIKRKSKKIK